MMGASATGGKRKSEGEGVCVCGIVAVAGIDVGGTKLRAVLSLRVVALSVCVCLFFSLCVCVSLEFLSIVFI